MAKKIKEDTVEVKKKCGNDGFVAVFMAYEGTQRERCNRCAMANTAPDYCLSVPCCAEEREDGQDGYYRRVVRDGIDYQERKGGAQV